MRVSVIESNCSTPGLPVETRWKVAVSLTGIITAGGEPPPVTNFAEFLWKSPYLVLASLVPYNKSKEDWLLSGACCCRLDILLSARSNFPRDPVLASGGLRCAAGAFLGDNKGGDPCLA